MKKIIITTITLTTIILFIVVLIVNSTPASPLQRMQDNIDFINNNDGKIYLYRDSMEILNEEVNISTIDTLHEINFNNRFIIIAFTVKHYDVMTKEFTQELFSLLSRGENIMLVFLDFLDYNFLQYTEFFNEQSYHPSINYVKTFDNFENTIQRRSTGIISMGGAAPALIEEQLISAVASRILSFNQSL